MSNLCQKVLSKDQRGGGGGGLRLGSKEEGPKGVPVCVCVLGGGGCFASLVGDKFLNFGQNLTY